MYSDDAKELYKQTERRLYAYNDIKAKLENDIKDIEDLKKEGIPKRSKDIIYRDVSGNGQLSSEELQELQQIKIDKISKQAQDCRRELSRLDDALKAINDDDYGQIIRLKFIEKKRDEYIAELMCCDASTIRRHRSKLVKRIAIRLYGESAI